MKILQEEEQHSSLALAYDEVSNDKQNMTMKTRSATRGKLNSVYASTKVYYGSFLPRTIRDTKGTTS